MSILGILKRTKKPTTRYSNTSISATDQKITVIPQLTGLRRTQILSMRLFGDLILSIYGLCYANFFVHFFLGLHSVNFRGKYFSKSCNFGYRIVFKFDEVFLTWEKKIMQWKSFEISKKVRE